MLGQLAGRFLEEHGGPLRQPLEGREARLHERRSVLLPALLDDIRTVGFRIRIEVWAGDDEVRQQRDTLFSSARQCAEGVRHPAGEAGLAYFCGHQRQQILVGGAAHVLAVNPLQLVDVEHEPGLLTRSMLNLSISSSRQKRPPRRCRDPAEQCDEVHQGFRQVAFVAIVFHRDVALSFGKLAAIGVEQQRKV